MPWFVPTQTLADPLPTQSIRLRQGDRLSAIATVIEDEYGTVVDLTDARAYLTLRPLSAPVDTKMLDHVEMVIELPATNGLVTYDWQASQTMGASPGLYDLTIDVEYIAGANAGQSFTVPSQDQQAVIELRSSIASDWFLVDNEGALIPDGDGGFEIFNPLLLENGMYYLLEDGTYLLIDEPT
jgi:hypothetical protein